MGTLFFFASWVAAIFILWDTVPVRDHARYAALNRPFALEADERMLLCKSDTLRDAAALFPAAGKRSWAWEVGDQMISSLSYEWRGGGVVSAPTPRTYKMKVNKKVVKLAMKCALSEKIRENAFIAVDKIELDSFKTKGLVEVLLNLKAEGKVLVITNEANGNLELAGRNLPYACVENVNHVSVYQMKNSSCVIITKDAIARYEEVLK